MTPGARELIQIALSLFSGFSFGSVFGSLERRPIRRSVFIIVLIFGLAGLAVFLSLRVYRLEQMQKELKKQIEGAKQTREDEELIIQLNDGEIRQTLRSELSNVEDELRRCQAKSKKMPRSVKSAAVSPAFRR